MANRKDDLAALAPIVSSKRRCKTVIQILGRDFGVSIGPGQIVDFDQVIGSHDGKPVTIRESVDESCFEPIAESV